MMSGIQPGTASPHRGSPQQMFKKLDKNGDGTLDKDELAKIAKRTNQEPATTVKDLDTNNDGKVDASEMEAGAAKFKHAGHSKGKGKDGGMDADGDHDGSQGNGVNNNPLYDLQKDDSKTVAEVAK